MQYKISVLVFLKDEQGRFLLIQRSKEPNRGLWSPIGGKLEMAVGESPFECAVRETREETGLEIACEDLHLFCMAAEKAYEGTGHWLMFLFDCAKAAPLPPEAIEEGTFAFFRREEIDRLDVPSTDREGLWPIYDAHREGFVALRADCHPGGPLDIAFEQIIPPPESARSAASSPKSRSRSRKPAVRP